MPYYYLYCEEDENSTSHNVVKEIRVRVHLMIKCNSSNHIVITCVYVCDVIFLIFFLLLFIIYYISSSSSSLLFTQYVVSGQALEDAYYNPRVRRASTQSGEARSLRPGRPGSAET